MIRTVLTLAMLAALGGTAGAEPAAPRLKEFVAVNAELVRIGDLIENAGPAANIPVFRAPDLGQTGAVPVARVAEALRTYDITALDDSGISEVVVMRLSRKLTGKDIIDRIGRAFAGQYGIGDAQNLAVVLDRELRTLHVEPNATGDLVANRMTLDPRTGRFDIAFELPGSAVARRLPLRFTGTLTETVPTATLTHAMRTGEIIKASDVVIERRPKAEVAGEAMTAEQAIGFAAKVALRGGQSLRQSDLVRPLLVQRNESVTLFYEVPGITVTVRGKALEPGAMGDSIGVLNIQSNRTIQATVTAPGRVTVAAYTPKIAAASPAPAEEESESPRTQ